MLTGALFTVSLLPRLCAIGRYVTPDELAWVYRSVQFREALLQGRWADTLVTGHPGVTTTWLGTVAISIQLALKPSLSGNYQWITQLAWLAPDNTTAFVKLATFLTAGRLAVALMNSLGIVGIYALGRSLFGPRPAVLGGLLLALDPYVSGLSGLFHIDGLAATFATLSLLALGLAAAPTLGGGVSADPKLRRRYAVAAGALAALAALTKVSNLLLIPCSGAVLLCEAVHHRRSRAMPVQPWMPGVLWAAGWTVTTVLALPAVWAVPAQVIETVTGETGRYVGQGLHAVFFMGRFATTHGPLFYPAVLAFRLSPIALIGAVLALPLAVLGLRPNRPSSPALLGLLLWALVFVVAISLVGQKFSRYALPAIIPLTLVAAEAWSQIAGRWHRSPRWGKWQGSHWLAFLLVSLQALLLLLALPHPLTAFNPLLGGARTAERVFATGWGEGISAAAHWLAARPDAASATATASNLPSFAPFFTGRTLPFDDQHVPQADYLVLNANPWEPDPVAAGLLSPNAHLIHTIRIGGLDQARIYRQANPQPPSPPIPNLPSPFSFDHRVQLLGAVAEPTSDRIRLTVRWGLAQPGGRYSVHLSVKDSWGHTWREMEAPLLNTVYFHPQHWEPGETPEIQYSLGLPRGIVPAEYGVELSLFDAESGSRLPLWASDGTFRGVAYTSSRISVPRSPEPVAPAGVKVPVQIGAGWFQGNLTLLGSSAPPIDVLAGSEATFELYWQPQAPLPDGLQLNAGLGDSVRSTFPLSRYPSGRWRSGELIREQYSLLVPPQLSAGRYALSVFPTTADGTPLEGPEVSLGEVTVTSPERLFELPPGIPTLLNYRLGQHIRLRGLALKTMAAAPGDKVHLTLYWQAEAQPDRAYTAFVHLVGPEGSIVAQADRWPGDSPSDAWAAGQVIVDEYSIALPEEAPPGQYRVAVGLYDAATGHRLPLTDAAGAQVPDDRLFLPAAFTVTGRHE